MLSQSKNRVQAIKCKFENLNDTGTVRVRKKSVLPDAQLCKRNISCTDNDLSAGNDKENTVQNIDSFKSDQNGVYSDITEELPLEPNTSYLYKKVDGKKCVSDTKKSLTRQISDPGKKLHRSHAFRCDRTQKIQSPKRHGSCNGRSETSDFTLKCSDKKLSKERLKKLGNFIEDQMRKEGFVPTNTMESNSEDVTSNPQPYCSIPDENVPKHILDQYAKVLKPKKKDFPQDKQDAMTDSGVSSETENIEEEKGRIKKLRSQFENEAEPIVPLKSNLDIMDNELCSSSETMKLERKNPHLTLTDTLKKALKQPLPPGPPPKKPPRLLSSPTPEKSAKTDTKQMLEKLELVLQKREAQKSDRNIYDIAETDLSVGGEKPKEIHYLCTEILDITQRTLLPNQSNSADVLKNCFNSLNCAAVLSNRSMSSLPYIRLSTASNNSISSDSLEDKPRLSTFLAESRNTSEKEHIYDVPFTGLSTKTDTNNSLVLKCGSVKSGVKSEYGVVNSDKVLSRSMDDLRICRDVEKIYDIPCDESRPATPEVPEVSPKSEFERIRANFESNAKRGPDVTKNIPEEVLKQERRITFAANSDKPIPLPKPTMKIPSEPKLKLSKSSENLKEDFKRSLEKKFATEKRVRRFEKNDGLANSGMALSIARKKDQLDVDRENLNRLMNEIYDTVTAACRMDEQKPSKFPTESDSTSEDSVKLTRSLTEKRKNYVRRVSSKAAYLDPKAKIRYRHQTSVCSYKSEILDNPYSTFRSWKSFRTSQNNINKSDSYPTKMADVFDGSMSDSKFNLTDSSGNLLSMKDELDLSMDNLSIDDKAGCLGLDLPEKREQGLFDLCLLVGLNHMTGQAYVKSVFPSQVTVPPHIENLVFPETISLDSPDSKIEYELAASKTQSYSLVLTDEKGERNYGYCRRVLPEGASCCLPLCYCVIGRYRAPGFYYKVLKEIESHHGSSEVEINTILQQLFETDFPKRGVGITIDLYRDTKEDIKKNAFRNSINLGDVLKSKTLPDQRKSPKKEDDLDLPEYYDLENNNRPRKVLLSLDNCRSRCIKRPLEPRVDDDNLSILLDTLGAGLLIKVFATLLLERKVVLISDNLSQLSSCMEALQSILYPFVWQQPLISALPAEIKRDIMGAPIPILAGSLETNHDWLEKVDQVIFEEGMLIDITNSTPNVLFYQGDESTILPTVSYKTLKTSLQMESSRNQSRVDRDDGKTRNVFISEAFLRFFVDMLKDFWSFFSVGEVKDGDMGRDGVVFEKDNFLKSITSKQNQYFLEWFTETSMFNHFIQNMAVIYPVRSSSQTIDYSKIEGIVDAPLPDFYELFQERISSNRKNSQKPIDGAKSNYKMAVNKKVKLLKSKLRDLVN